MVIAKYFFYNSRLIVSKTFAFVLVCKIFARFVKVSIGSKEEVNLLPGRFFCHFRTAWNSHTCFGQFW